MKKLLLILLCLPMIGFGQETECISVDCENEQGTMTWLSVSKFVGEFMNGKFYGQRTYTYASGTIEKGLCENDVFLGE